MARDRFAAAFAECGERHKGTRIGMLWADYNNSTGDATLTIEFLDMPPLCRADILKDAIGVLEREYELAVASMRTRGAD